MADVTYKGPKDENDPTTVLEIYVEGQGDDPARLERFFIDQKVEDVDDAVVKQLKDKAVTEAHNVDISGSGSRSGSGNSGSSGS